MLISFMYPVTYELGHGHIPEGLRMLIWSLWRPAPLISIGGIVIGGLFFAYGKNAFCPWLGLIADAGINGKLEFKGGVALGDQTRLIADVGINDKLDLAKAVAILKTAQKLVMTSGLIMCGMFILIALDNLDQGWHVTVAHAAFALVSLIYAGLISLLFIVPVRAYWEGQSLSDND